MAAQGIRHQIFYESPGVVGQEPVGMPTDDCPSADGLSVQYKGNRTQVLTRNDDVRWNNGHTVGGDRQRDERMGDSALQPDALVNIGHVEGRIDPGSCCCGGSKKQQRLVRQFLDLDQLACAPIDADAA